MKVGKLTFLRFIVGTGSSICFTLLGVYILLQQLKEAPVLLGSGMVLVVAFSGFIYIFLQGLQILNISLKRISGGITDWISSLLPLIAIFGILFMHFPSTLHEWMLLALYCAPVIIDIGIFMPISLKIFQLVSDAIEI